MLCRTGAPPRSVLMVLDGSLRNNAKMARLATSTPSRTPLRIRFHFAFILVLLFQRIPLRSARQQVREQVVHLLDLIVVYVHRLVVGRELCFCNCASLT